MATDPNVSTLTQSGLAIESKPNLVAWLISQYQVLYGSDINVNSNSPDGQLINIFAQCMEDLLELLLDTYNNFAVDTSFGERLDELVALNGLARVQGTSTMAKVVVTATQALTLPGLDQSVVPAFTVADNAGNQFQLVTSQVFGGPGPLTLTFKAVTIGAIQTTANTITNITTSTLGISTVNNPSVSLDIIGTNEETDAQLKVRHGQSFNLGQTGSSDAMEAALRNIADVTDAYVVENNTGGVVSGIPANSVWPIVAGGTSLEIGTAIYAKKSPGCGLKGAVTQLITRPNGATFTAQWDVPIAQPLYIKFLVIWIGPQLLAPSDIETALAAVLVYKLGQNPSIGDIIKAMQVIAPTAVVSIDSAIQGVSVDNALWNSIVVPTGPQYYFTVSASNIVVT